MKKLVIIGANDFQNQLILKAKSLGYETHVFAWKCGDVGELTADYFYPISIIEKEQILEECKKIKPNGVCSIASDLAAITVNYVAENLGLPCNSTKYTTIQTNKYEMRKAMMNAGIDCPKFALADENFNLSLFDSFSYPIIVKPTDRSGSRNIMKLNSSDGIDKAIKEACETSFEHRAIVEEYIAGNEYSMETITSNGKHTFLAITKKYTTGAPHFIETGHMQPADLTEEIKAKAIEIIFKALDALHVENSAGHSEFKVDENGDIKIIEIGARMGGDCIGSDLVYLSTGNDFLKLVIDIACGNKVEFTENEHYGSAGIKFIFSNNDIDELNKQKSNNQLNIYRISKIDVENIGHTIDSSSRAGYYIFVSDSSEQIFDVFRSEE